MNIENGNEPDVILLPQLTPESEGSSYGDGYAAGHNDGYNQAIHDVMELNRGVVFRFEDKE